MLLTRPMTRAPTECAARCLSHGVTDPESGTNLSRLLRISKRKTGAEHAENGSTFPFARRAGCWSLVLRNVDRVIRVGRTVAVGVHRRASLLPIVDVRASASQSSRERLVDSRAQNEIRAVGSLLHHLTQPVNLGEQSAFARSESNLRDRLECARLREQRSTQRLESALGLRRYEHRVRQQIRYALLQRNKRLGGDAVDLVECVKHWLVVDPELIEHCVHDASLFFPTHVARVDHVQQEVGVDDLLERRAERRHEMVRQLADEANRVGEQDAIVLAEIDLTRERVERGEQAVFNENITRA